MCCDLRTACVVLTALAFLGSIQILFQSAKGLTSGNYGMPITNILRSACALLVNGFCFYGTFKKREKFILPALIYTPIYFVVEIVDVILKGVNTNDDNKNQIIIGIIVGVIFGLVLNIIMWILLYKYRKQIMEEDTAAVGINMNRVQS